MPHRVPLLVLLLSIALGAPAVETPAARDATLRTEPLPPLLPPDDAAAEPALDDAALAAPAPPPPPIDLDYRLPGSSSPSP